MFFGCPLRNCPSLCPITIFSIFRATRTDPSLLVAAPAPAHCQRACQPLLVSKRGFQLQLSRKRVVVNGDPTSCAILRNVMTPSFLQTLATGEPTHIHAYVQTSIHTRTAVVTQTQKAAHANTPREQRLAARAACPRCAAPSSSSSRRAGWRAP